MGIPHNLDGEILRRELLKTYSSYCAHVNYGYKVTKVHKLICDTIQNAVDHPGFTDTPYKIVLISCPPQLGKTLTVTDTAPSWILTKNPRTNVIAVGYEARFASGFGRRNRDKFIEYANDINPTAAISKDIQGREEWETTLGGGMQTAGLGGPITGKRAKYFFVDDPTKNMKGAESEIGQIDTIEYFQSVIETRLNGNPGSILFVIQTRWVENDLFGWLEQNRKKHLLKVLNIPAECEDEATDPLGRKLGDGPCPEMGKGREYIQTIKESYLMSEGSHVWNALYQGHPTDVEGNLFKAEWFQRYKYTHFDFKETEYNLVSVDATFKENKDSDFVVIKVMSLKGENTYLRYVCRRKMSFTQTFDKICEICKKYDNLNLLAIEDKANGSALIDLMRKYAQNHPEVPMIIGINPLGGKVVRATAITPYVRDRHYFLPEECPTDWDIQRDIGEEHMEGIDVIIKEFLTFPYGKHDDLVDATSQGLVRIIKIVSGDEPIPQRRYSKYVQWYPDMWEDYERMTTAEKAHMISVYGAPLEWKKE